MADTAVGV